MKADKSKKPTAEFTQSFFVNEATYFRGGFGAFMMQLMDRMKGEMTNAGSFGPYDWKWSGGDGVTVPVILHCVQED